MGYIGMTTAEMVDELECNLEQYNPNINDTPAICIEELHEHCQLMRSGEKEEYI